MPEVELKISSKNLTRKALQEIQKDLDTTAKKLVKAAEESEKFGKKGESALAKLRRSVKGIKADFGALAISAGAISAGLTFLTKSFISSAVATQKMKAGLLAVSSSAKEAETQFKRLEEVAKLPGLGLPEAVQGATRLMSVGMSAEKAAKTLAAFGNALATVGKGRAELSLVVEQLAQMSAKGKILAEDLKPIVSQSGLVAKAMKEAFGTSNLEDIRKLGLSTKEFLNILVTELEKLPQVSGGVANAFENLSDNIEKIKSDFGTILLPTVEKITNALATFVERINNLSDTQKSMIAWGTVGAASITGFVAAVAGLSLAIPHVISAVKALGVAITFLSAHPLILAATAIAALTAGIGYYIWSSKNARYSSEKFAEALDKVSQKTEKLKGINTLTDRLEELRAKTELTVEEQKELVDVQNELIKLAPRLLSKYDNEGNAIAKTTTEIKKYSAELRKAINLERKIAIERAERELPKVEEDLKTVQRQLRIFEGLQAQMEPRKRMGTAEALLKSFYSPELGRVLTTYDKYLEEWDRVNDKQKVLIEKRDKLRADLESSGMPSEGKPDLGKPSTVVIPDTKEADKVFQAWADMERARVALISDGYQREREEAILSNKIIIHNIEKQLKEKEIQTERASHLNQQLSFEKEKLDQKLADIDKRFAQERRERISKDILAEREAIQQGMEERRKAHEETNRLMSRDTQAEIEAIQRGREERQRASEEINQLVRDNAKVSFSLIKDTFERREAEAQFFYESEVDRIGKILATEEASFEKVAELNKRLHLLKLQLLDEYDTIDAEKKEAQEKRLKSWITLVQKVQSQFRELIAKQPVLDIDTRRQMIQPFAREVTTTFFDIIKDPLTRVRMTKQANEELISLEQEKNDRLRDIRADDTLSVRERAREIERIEKESAERRANIEHDLMERKKALFGDYLKNFAAGIARQIELILQRKAAEKITEFAMSKLGWAAAAGGAAEGAAVTGGGFASIASIGSVVPPLLFAYVGAKVLGFDNPVHDRLAQISGGNTAMLMGASFDDPYNDLKAKLRGTYAASRDLGRRSAEDMLQNFQAGFIQKSKTLSDENDKLSNVLERMENRLNDSPQFQLIIDGKPLHAILKRIDDSAAFRERSY